MKTDRIFLSPPWVGDEERNAVAGAFDSGYVAPCGPFVDEFEAGLKKLTGLNAAAVASGTAAIDLVMDQLLVDETSVIIAPTLTFISTVGPAYHRKAQIVFVDIDPETGTMSVPLLKSALYDNQDSEHVVVIGVDIYGQCCDYDAIEEECGKYENVTLVIDAAESVGATYKGRPSGTCAKAAIYSFNGNKLITTSGGGAVLSESKDFIDKSRWLSQQAREKAVWYQHEVVGYNYRMSNILAAVGCAQLNRIPEIIRRKRRIFDFYCNLFGCSATTSDCDVISPYPCGTFTESTRWLSVFLFPTPKEANDVANRLAAANIECRPVWKPLHLQPVFEDCEVYDRGVAEDAFNRGLCLPSGAGMTDADLERIAKAIKP